MTEVVDYSPEVGPEGEEADLSATGDGTGGPEETKESGGGGSEEDSPEKQPGVQRPQDDPPSSTITEFFKVDLNLDCNFRCSVVVKAFGRAWRVTHSLRCGPGSRRSYIYVRTEPLFSATADRPAPRYAVRAEVLEERAHKRRCGGAPARGQFVQLLPAENPLQKVTDAFLKNKDWARSKSVWLWLTVDLDSIAGCSPVSLPTGGFRGAPLHAAPASELECPVCMYLLRDPVELPCCGFLACESCLRACAPARCPGCRTAFVPGNAATFPPYSRLRQRAVMAVAIQCPNATEGCTWSGTVQAAYGDHFSNVGHLARECECTFSIPIRVLSRRPLLTTPCLLSTRMHADSALPCRLGCGKVGSRKTMLSHCHTECPHSFADCPVPGCTVRLQRSAIPKHLEGEPKHVTMCLLKVGVCVCVGVARRPAASPMPACMLTSGHNFVACLRCQFSWPRWRGSWLRLVRSWPRALANDFGRHRVYASLVF